MDLAAASHLHQLDLANRSASPHTLLQYDMVHVRFAAWCRRELSHATIYDLTAENVRDFLGWLREGHRDESSKLVHHGPKSLAAHVVALKALAAFLDRTGVYPQGNPLERVRVPRPKAQAIPRFSLKEVDRMLRLCSSTAYPLRNRAVLSLLIETGMRVSELCDLETLNVALARLKDNGRALIRGKGAKTRHVYFGTKASMAIGLYLSRERPESPRPQLFLARTGGPMTRSLVDHLIKDVAKLAGIEGVRASAHTLRHTFATNYLRQNPGQLAQLQRLLGHESSTMTLYYARLAQEDVAGSYRSLLDGMQ